MTQQSDDKLWLSGNEAFALGAFEAGVTVASGYPGTPSTEILENFSKYDGIYAEWAPNEKVALEVAIGASFAGARVLATMKHVGLNVAADPLFTAAYTGVRGGLVIINADDPQMHSSQNEQDNRNYALAAKLPMLEPSNPAEGKEFIKKAFLLSEQFDTPVLVRTTTRVSHVKGVVEKGEKLIPPVPVEIVRDPAKLVMLPANARKRRQDIEARMTAMREFAESFEENRIEMAAPAMGIITGGVSYNYVKEAFPDASVLKIGMTWPLPDQMIRDFAGKVKKLYVVEELDPFIERHVKTLGLACEGRNLVPGIGELDSFIVRKALGGPTPELFEAPTVPPRPPNMCAGCPHRGLFYNLNRLKVFVSGDIGCYTLGFLPPLSAMDSCVCMGASIGVAHGMTKALGEAGMGKVVAVIGDSTFCHSGITGLLNTVYNQSYATVIILDNRITAMTGHQENPASGQSLMAEPANAVDLSGLCRALGVEHVSVVDPHDIDATYEVLKREIERPEPSVVITRFPCVLIPSEKKRKKDRYTIDRDACTGCGSCLKIGCPAINWVPTTPEESVALGLTKKEKQKGYSIITEMCAGCGQCLFLCKFSAINKEDKA